MFTTSPWQKKLGLCISTSLRLIGIEAFVLLFGLTSAGAALAEPLALAQVRSFAYVIAVDLYSPTLPSAIASSPYDLVILGGGEVPIARDKLDPRHEKLLLGYIDACEGSPYWYPQLFIKGTPPSWFGKPVIGFDRLYSVQYWNPQWKPLLFHRIDQVIAAGYDGIFLDVLDGHFQWSEGNRLGNPVYSNGIPAMATLLSDIRSYVESGKQKARGPFYIVGNNPTGIGEAFPDSLKALDGIFSEWLFWGPLPDDGTRSQFGTGNFEYISSRIVPLYKRAGIPVFGNDYPYPLSDKEAVAKTFDFYSSIGWVSSVTNAYQDTRIISSGPFLFTATPLNPKVVGSKNFVNYLSGGNCPEAMLEGGDRGDVFVGGAGSNTIRGGNGDDLIYAHPADVILRNRIVLTLVADVNNSPNPAISIFVNGKLAQGPVKVTATFQNRETQRIMIDVSPSETVETIELVGNVAAYVDQTHYANIQIIGLSLTGEPVDFVLAQYNSDSRILNNRSLALMNHKGRILFPRAAIPRPSTVFGSATDIINGGGGTDTVVYRAAAGNYAVKRLADGSYMVTSEITNEGPDKLWNIEHVRFSDKEVRLAP
jgi:hypothetical protein